MGGIYIFPICYIHSIGYMGDIMKCPWCSIEREELYMGGGLTVYKCPRCNSRMEVKE